MILSVRADQAVCLIQVYLQHLICVDNHTVTTSEMKMNANNIHIF